MAVAREGGEVAKGLTGHGVPPPARGHDPVPHDGRAYRIKLTDLEAHVAAHRIERGTIGQSLQSAERVPVGRRHRSLALRTDVRNTGWVRTSDPDRIRAAKLAGRAQRLRDLTLTEAARWDALRAEWPELIERVEAVVALVDWERSPSGDS